MIKKIQQIQRRVGEFQLSQFRQMDLAASEEKITNEFVSFVDRESEKIIAEGLAKLLPKAGFLGEEEGQSGSRDIFWIVDPLDGTTNYLSGLDQFSISIALYDHGQVTHGSIYKPISDEFFWAVRGEGAWHNNKRLSGSPITKLKQALVGTGFPYRSADLQSQFFPCAQEVLNKSRGLRRFGSAALDIAYVAAGYLQAFWESDLQPYDVAAALLLCQEAGIHYSATQKKDYDLFNSRLLICGTPIIWQDLEPIISAHYQ